MSLERRNVFEWKQLLYGPTREPVWGIYFLKLKLINHVLEEQTLSGAAQLLGMDAGSMSLYGFQLTYRESYFV